MKTRILVAAALVAVTLLDVQAKADGFRLAPAGSADPVPVAAQYELADDTLDNSYTGRMLQADNILRAADASMSFYEASLNGYNNDSFYEKQTDDISCITNGMIPVHRDQDG